jgi:hypothetical protein
MILMTRLNKVPSYWLFTGLSLINRINKLFIYTLKVPNVNIFDLYKKKLLKSIRNIQY